MKDQMSKALSVVETIDKEKFDKYKTYREEVLKPPRMQNAIKVVALGNYINKNPKKALNEFINKGLKESMASKHQTFYQLVKSDTFSI